MKLNKVLSLDCMYRKNILKCDHSNKNYNGVLSCGTVCYILFKVVLTDESVNELLKCDHSNENCFHTQRNLTKQREGHPR